jgi:hypothetical protein
VPEIEKLVPVREVEQSRPDAIKAEFGASGEEIRADARAMRFDRFSDGFVFHALAKCSALPRKLFPRRTIHQIRALTDFRVKPSRVQDLLRVIEEFWADHGNRDDPADRG